MSNNPKNKFSKLYILLLIPIISLVVYLYYNSQHKESFIKEIELAEVTEKPGQEVLEEEKGSNIEDFLKSVTPEDVDIEFESGPDMSKGVIDPAASEKDESLTGTAMDNAALTEAFMREEELGIDSAQEGSDDTIEDVDGIKIKPDPVVETVETADESVADFLPAPEYVESADKFVVNVDVAESERLFTDDTAISGKEGAGEKIVVLPFDNFSVDDSALFSVMPAIQKKLAEYGYSVVTEDELYAFICDKKLRETGMISNKLAEEISGHFNAKGIIIGSVLAYLTEGRPQFGMVARLIDPVDGSIIWADYYSATGGDFISVLGLGEIRKMNKLITEVTDRLFKTFTLEHSKEGDELKHKVAVISPMNNTKYKDAGKIALQLFIVNLFKSGNFEPIEYGEVRKHTNNLRVRAKGELDHKSMGALAKALNVDGFVLMDVRDFFSGNMRGLPPKAAISARLVSAGNNKILWYAHDNATGDDDVIVYDWRRLGSVDKVANKIVVKFVKDMGKVKWN